MNSEQRLVAAVTEMAVPGEPDVMQVSTVRLSRYRLSGETRLMVVGPDRALATVVNHFGYDYHVIGLGREHVVLLVTEDAAAAYARRKAAA